MAAKPAGLEPRISDLVVESRIEAAWDAEAEQTTQIRTAVGVSARRRRLKSEETWKRKRILGRGAYGTVWLEECIASSGPRHGESNLRAIKEIHKRPHGSASEFHRELEAIAKFSHDRFAHCFVRSLGWFQNDQSLFITMEYLKYGDLQHYLTKPFPEPEARQISLQVVEALQLMHESGFAHRDLKPGNILVFQKGPAWWVKIADFGISKRGVEASTVLRTMEIGTRGFMAPEILGLYCPDDFDEEAFEADEAAHDALAYTPVVDLWALGEITHRLLTQKPAFETRGRLWSYVTKGTAFPANELQAVGASAQGISFIQQAMAASPKTRLTAAAAMSHDWLENHEFLDETRSRSSTESAREISPSGMTAMDYEASAQWTDISRENESIMKLDEDESLTPATQMSAAEKFEAKAAQSEEPSTSTTIVAEDVQSLTAQPAISNLQTRFDRVLDPGGSAASSDSPAPFNPAIPRQSEEPSASTTIFAEDLPIAKAEPAITREDIMSAFLSRSSPNATRADKTATSAAPVYQSSLLNPEIAGQTKEPPASNTIITEDASYEVISENLSQLAIAPRVDRELRPLPNDGIPQAAQEEFRNIFAPAFDTPSENTTKTRLAPVMEISSITQGVRLTEFPETEQANAICVLRNPESQYMSGVEIVGDVCYTDSNIPSANSFPFLFVEYNMDDFDHNSPEEMQLLHLIAEKTARSLGLLAYWGVLGRRRSPASVRTKTQAVNHIAEFSNHFLFICRSELSHDLRGLTRIRHLGRHLSKWASLFDSVPVLVPALAKAEFHVYSVHEDATEIVLHPAMSRMDFFNMMWNSKLSNAPLAFRILLKDAERATPVLRKLEKTLCLMDILAGAQAPPAAPHEYLHVLRDYCEWRGNMYLTDLFTYFVGICLANAELNLLGRWLCIPQSKDYSSWGIKHLLGGSGHWEPATKIDTVCKAIGLRGDGIIQYEGGWGHNIHFFASSKNRSIIDVFKKRAPLPTQRFLVAWGALSVPEVKDFLPGLRGMELSVNPLLQNHAAAMFMSHWTLVDAHLGIITHFLAYNRPVKIILCGREDGGVIVRAMLCSDGAKQVFDDSATAAPVDPMNVLFNKENIVRIDGTGMDGMTAYMGRFRVSISPGNPKDTAEAEPSVRSSTGTSSRRSFTPSFDIERAKDRVMEHFFEI